MDDQFRRLERELARSDRLGEFVAAVLVGASNGVLARALEAIGDRVDVSLAAFGAGRAWGAWPSGLILHTWAWDGPEEQEGYEAGVRRAIRTSCEFPGRAFLRPIEVDPPEAVEALRREIDEKGMIVAGVPLRERCEECERGEGLLWLSGDALVELRRQDRARLVRGIGGC